MKQLSIPYLHLREHRSGRNFYYLEIPQSSPRSEVGLGAAYEDALRQRSLLLTRHYMKDTAVQGHILPMLALFELVQVPTLDITAKRENSRSLKHLHKFFRERAQYQLSDIGSKSLHDEYLTWRAHRFNLSARGELSLLKRVAKMVQGWIALAAPSQIQG